MMSYVPFNQLIIFRMLHPQFQCLSNHAVLFPVHWYTKCCCCIVKVCHLETVSTQQWCTEFCIALQIPLEMMDSPVSSCWVMTRTLSRSNGGKLVHYYIKYKRDDCCLYWPSHSTCHCQLSLVCGLDTWKLTPCPEGGNNMGKAQLRDFLNRGEKFCKRIVELPQYSSSSCHFPDTLCTFTNWLTDWQIDNRDLNRRSCTSWELLSHNNNNNINYSSLIRLLPATHTHYHQSLFVRSTNTLGSC